MSGRLDDLWASLLSVADNGRAVWRRARSSVQDEITAVKFKIQTALMEILWSILGLSRFLLPILKFIALVWAIFFAAIGLYYIIYQRYVPKLMLEEPIHFNFAIDAPSAKLNLLMPNDHSGEILSSLHYGRPLAEKYLRPGSIYEFSLKFTVAKSPRNQNIGKFMSYLTVMDRKDEPVARSARPVVVPYHSDLFLIADQIFKLPLYFLGAEEAETIQILMLRNYKEPYNEAASTKTVEVSISRSDVDILHCTLTIYPELNWFT